LASPVPPPADHRPQGRPGALPLRPRRARRLAALLACTALVAPGFALANAPALPQGGQFVAGQGSIGAASGNALTITQTSARGIIDWRSFNISQGASVTVQNGAGATLNRVTGGDLSQILGSLRATGSLYLVNPQGVVIGSSGVVVTGGRFVASSLDIANDAFMAGGTLVFRGSTENAEVRNLGSISSTGGDVILISRSVRNEGTITAPRGTAALTAGTEVLLREGPEGHRGMVRVSGASGDVTNTGRIEAAQAELRAAGGNIYALAGNTAGVIRATGTETRNGRVWLSAGAGTGGGTVLHEGRIDARNADGTGGKVAVRAGNAVLNTGTIAADGSSGGAVQVRAARVVQQGTISARGTSGAGGTITQRVTASYTDTARAVTTADGATNGGAVRIEGEPRASLHFAGRISATGESGTGGTVHLLGDHVALTAAEIDVSGATGGGRVRIGGGYRGGEGLPRASTVVADAATTIRADATRRGNGGDVVVWSDNRTDFAGRINARGGAEGGDGGQAEVSSRGVLAYTGTTDLRAPLGAWGTLLLDPYNITISDGTQTTGGGFTANADDSVINVDVLLGALGMANVIVSTGTGGTQAGNITVTAPLAWTSGSILTLQAAGAINLNEAITAGAGGLTLDAGGTISANAPISVGRFELVRGAWVQNSANLPSFAATDFLLTGGTFLRTTGGAVGPNGAGASSLNPWLLTDIYGVQGMATRLTEHYRLTSDIAAAGTASWNGGQGFRPIGTDTDTTRFTGSLDGDGRVINGLTINRPTQEHVGLFGVTGTGSTISNIGLVGGSVTGNLFVGALAGSSRGVIERAFSTTDVTGVLQPNDRGGRWVGGLIGYLWGRAEQVHATGSVNGSAFVGGLVGGHAGTIRRAYATGGVSASSWAGGLVGDAPTGLIEDVYATGAVTAGNRAGGLIGYVAPSGGQRLTVTRAYASGQVSITDTTGLLMQGGLVGQGSFQRATFNASFWDIDTTGQSRAQGNITLPVSGLTGLTSTQASLNPRSQTPYASSPANWDFTNVWFQAGDMRPILRSELPAAVNGVTTIRNVNQLQLVSTNLGGSYRLGNDINATATGTAATNPAGIWGTGGFVPIGTDAARFTGSLDGAGRVISGLTINRPRLNDVGLFGATATGSTISNIGLLGGSVTGATNVGALAGSNRGIIERTYATGAVSGTEKVGGLVGIVAEAGGAIRDSYALGSVTGATDGTDVGGLVGSNSGVIERTYATGLVTGATNLGALAGTNASTGNIAASVWNTTVNGSRPGIGSNSGTISNVTGRTTAEMQDITTFRTTYAGWDFNAVWAPPNQVGQGNGSGPGSGGANYPQLYAASTVAAVFVNDQARVYGDANPTSGTRIAGLRAGDNVRTPTTLTSPATMASPIGTYALDGSGTAIASPAGNVYRIVHVPGTLSVTPRPITVTADAQRRPYGAPNPPLTFSVVRTGGGIGLVNNDELSGQLATTAGPSSNIGDYRITRGNLAASDNYALTFVENWLTITPATLVVTAEDARRRQWQPNLVFTFRTSGLVAGDTTAVIRGLELVSPATLNSRPGTYPITPVGGSAANYTLVRVDGILTIEPLAEGVEGGPIIGTSNAPPPAAQLGPPEGSIRPVAAVPLRAASNECGAGASVGIVRCTSGFPALQN
jgi:filamentous hemagglutinin family protein